MDIIYEEKVSGATQDRAELQNMLNVILGKAIEFM